MAWVAAAPAAAFNSAETGKRDHRIMGDGGFWHNGLTSGVGNAVFNKSDNVLIMVDNGYTAATGGQDILSSEAANPIRTTRHLDREGGARRRREMGARQSRVPTTSRKMRDTLRRR